MLDPDPEIPGKLRAGGSGGGGSNNELKGGGGGKLSPFNGGGGGGGKRLPEEKLESLPPRFNVSKLGGGAKLIKLLFSVTIWEGVERG